MSCPIKFCVLGSKAGGVPHIDKHPAGVAVLTPEELLLFDCGEGTQLQLLRAGLKPGSVRNIFISHLHPDHVLGLPALLAGYASLRRRSGLKITGPSGIREWIEATLLTLGVPLPFELHFRELEDDNSGEVYQSDRLRISCSRLEHRVTNFGYRLEEIVELNVNPELAAAFGLREGKQIGELKRRGRLQLPDGREVTVEEVAQAQHRPRIFAYSGDTRPCEALRHLATDADVLLNEATFTEAHRERAAYYCHTTARQAAAVARDAGVQRLFLTHISTRYSDLQEHLSEARTLFPATFIARELAIEDLRP